MSEIRAPFIAVGVAVFFLAVTVILAGVFAFLRITGPMLRKMQEDEKNLLQLETAREASRAKNEFLSMAAHELRAPLSGISGFAQTLRDAAKNGWLAKKEDLLPDFLNRILHSSSYMAALIEELLEFSRIESGTVNIQYGAIDLRYALDIVKSNIMDKIINKELEFKFQIPPELPLIRTGLRQLTQILFNLIGNAVKFVDKKGVVTVLAAAEEGMVLVSVVDSGPGMDEETQKHVFEIFWRGNKARGIAGSGLGLSITKLLVERMGGKIWIKSKLGVGSTFYFTLEQWRENEQG
jgi:signal transduction histidine kinase